MTYVGPIGKILLILVFGLGLLLATAEDRELASLELFHPTTLLKFVTGRVRTVHAYVRALRVRDALPAAESQAPARRETAPPSLAQ